MLWVLSDIVLPLIATFLLGLFIGWLLWRWRRQRIDADGLSSLRRSSARYRADAERLEQSNIELSDRLQAASGARGGDLANARKRNDLLAEELKNSRREVAELKSGAQNQASDSADYNNADQDRIRELETQLQSAKTQLQTLSVSNDSDNGESNRSDHLQREIDARDRMIATLKDSLDQFGEGGDNTALMADVALRDRKIIELERLLANHNR